MYINSRTKYKCAYSLAFLLTVSSTRKKKRKKDDDGAQSKMYMKRSCCWENGYGKRADVSTVAAIERARVCLQKVQQFKSSFFQY